MGTASTVLLIDDDALMLSALSALLAREDRELVTARDALEGLKQISERKVDLVLLDLTLPGLDGLEALRSIRGADLRRGLGLPVIVLSGSDDRARRLAAIRLGVDDFVQKPFDPEELAARVDRSLDARHRVDELVREAAALEKLSVTDGLTQVFNHRFFQDRLIEEFRRAQRYDDPLALILIDLDHFKAINDRFGHPAGDQVLRDVAGCLRASVRETDTLCRYGGEEFAVLLPKTHLAGSLTVAERIWRDCAALTVGPDRADRVTASLGVAGYPSRAVLTSDQLLRAADDALYRAKREGRNKICLYQPPPHPPGEQPGVTAPSIKAS